MTERESVEEKKVNPGDSYHLPRDVVQDASLSQHEKVVILREWYYDAVRLQVSAGENMTGGGPDRLQLVSNALIELGVSPASEANPNSP